MLASVSNRLAARLRKEAVVATLTVARLSIRAVGAFPSLSHLRPFSREVNFLVLAWVDSGAAARVSLGGRLIILFSPAVLRALRADSDAAAPASIAGSLMGLTAFVMR